MNLYIQKFGKQKLVEIVGYTKKDVVLRIYTDNFKFAMTWDLFDKYYEKFEPFTCDIDEYEGADLSDL